MAKKGSGGAFQPKKKDVPPTNGYDVVIKFIDRSYALINSGNLVGAFLLMVIVIIFVIAIRLTPKDLNAQVGTIVAMVSSERYYIFPMSTLIGVLFIALYYERKTHVAEIKRLIKVLGQTHARS